MKVLVFIAGGVVMYARAFGNNAATTQHFPRADQAGAIKFVLSFQSVAKGRRSRKGAIPVGGRTDQACVRFLCTSLQSKEVKACSFSRSRSCINNDAVFVKKLGGDVSSFVSCCFLMRGISISDFIRGHHFFIMPRMRTDNV